MKHISQIHQGSAMPFADVLQRFTGLNHDETQLLIAMGGAYLGKYRCKDPKQLVKSGQQLSAYWRWPLVMDRVDFDPKWVLHDDDGFLVATKPSGIPTQGRRDADYMAFYEILKRHIGGYLALHHRLDQDTSGLMLFGRARTLNTAISTAFQTKKVAKTYLAIVGAWSLKEQEHLIDEPLAPMRLTKGTCQVVANHGKRAQTKIRLLAQEQNMSLIQANPLTGRTHQIRAHLSHLGMPLVGDSFYGSGETGPFMLHCAQLSWPNINSLKAMSFHSPIPANWADRIPAQLSRALNHWSHSPC